MKLFFVAAVMTVFAATPGVVASVSRSNGCSCIYLFLFDMLLSTCCLCNTNTSLFVMNYLSTHLPRSPLDLEESTTMTLNTLHLSTRNPKILPSLQMRIRWWTSSKTLTTPTAMVLDLTLAITAWHVNGRVALDTVVIKIAVAANTEETNNPHPDPPHPDPPHAVPLSQAAALRSMMV